MRTKILGLALMLSLAAIVGACENTNEPAGTTTPAPGEPADTGATPPVTPSPTTTP
ncbi:hypothetical protein I8751_00050 [Nostocaceae cyanobacterium CENA357]|uniref:Beta-Ig-H3/fasciclin n=1 Tax=Atlanticothrix silvestris CENA357 TaxID=1725252 RepID=A0A8J7L3H1_9CYAN|nr:hypothetical protein [Atlanticothrix silvestris]MBH8550807.1 hypothetical protein [Atlanticothrix silvestris CENA357]